MMQPNNNPGTHRGWFFAFEGIDGAGKTTQAKRLRDRLLAVGRSVVYVKEPTDGPWGQKIKEIATHGRDSVTPEEELDLFIRDREQDVAENIAPALKAQSIVIADRYYYSTIAYQSVLGLDPDEIRRLNDPFPVPDLVFMIELPPSMGQVRIIHHRREKTNLGYEQLDFLVKVKAAFDRMTDPNIVRIDGSLDQRAVSEIIWRRVTALIAS